MSEPPKFTPYRSLEDVFTLRDLFFKKSASPDDLENGVRQVHLWHTKGSVPHGINMTALIISIQLNDPKYNPRALASRLSLYSLRSAYSELVITLVNGFLDPFQGDVAFPILILAQRIGLPNFFVEFRHAATHDTLPSLETLRFLGERALVWLRDHFWTEENLLPPSVTIDALVGRPVPVVSKSKCVSLIKLYKSNQKRGIDNTSALNQLSALSRDQKQYSGLGKLLLNSKVLLAGSTLSKLKGFYGPLLKVFLDEFSLHLLVGLVAQCFFSYERTANLETVHGWITHFLHMIANWKYPLHSLHLFETPQDIKDYLRGYVGMLDKESAVYLENALDGKTRTFGAAPLLEDILGTTRLLSSEPPTESTENDVKRRKHKQQSIFETFPAWQPVPFGIYPDSRGAS